MSQGPQNKQRHGGRPPKPSDHHNNSPEELAAINETLKTLSKKQEENNETSARLERKHFRLQVGVALGVGLYTLLTAGLLIAALIQLRVSADTETRQLRAYVHITGGKTTVSGDPAGPLTISIRPGVKVFGQTPAGGVVVPWNVAVAEWPMTDSFKFNYLQQKMPTTSSQPTGEERPVEEKSRIITPEEIGSIKDGKSRFYAYGTIFYADVFRNARYTNFCWYFDLPHIIAAEATDCPIHNGADWNNSSEPLESRINVPMK